MANKRLNAIISIGGTVAASLKNAIGQTQAGFGRVGDAVKKLESRQRELNAVMSQQMKLGAQGSALKASYAQQELALVDKQIAKLKQLQAAEARIAAARKSNSERRATASANIGSTVAIGTVGALPFLKAIKDATEYQYQLQLIGNTANMSKAEIAGLSNAIMASSKETNQSATNTQNAIGFLIAAGMEVGLAQQLMTIVGKTATATGGEVEDMAKAVFTLNDSLKIKPGDMMAAMDTLAIAGKEGNVELKDMAKQLPVLAAGFSALKMEGREAAATMGAALEIARKGAATADEAANNMQNFMVKILSPETLKKAKKNFNLDLYKIVKDAQTTGKNPFEAAMVAIMKATKGDQKALGDLFQDMQVQNFLRPMMQNWEKYQEIKAKSLAGTGVVDADFEKMMTTGKEQLDKIGGAIGRFSIVLGGALAQAFGGNGGLAEKIDAATKWIDANRELVGTIAKVTIGFFGARLAVNGVVWAFTSLRAAWLVGQAIFLAIPAIASGAATALTAIGAAIAFIGRMFLLNPIGLAITGIAAAALLIYKYWDPIKAFFEGIWQTVSKVWKAVGGVFKGGAAPNDSAYDAMGNYTGGATLPAPATAGAKGGAGVTDNSTTTYNITQLPGQDAKALAAEIDKINKQKAAVNQRSSMYDGAW